MCAAVPVMAFPVSFCRSARDSRSAGLLCSGATSRTCPRPACPSAHAHRRHPRPLCPSRSTAPSARTHGAACMARRSGPSAPVRCACSPGDTDAATTPPRTLRVNASTIEATPRGLICVQQLWSLDATAALACAGKIRRRLAGRRGRGRRQRALPQPAACATAGAEAKASTPPRQTPRPPFPSPDREEERPARLWCRGCGLGGVTAARPAPSGGWGGPASSRGAPQGTLLSFAGCSCCCFPAHQGSDGKGEGEVWPLLSTRLCPADPDAAPKGTVQRGRTHSTRSLRAGP